MLICLFHFWVVKQPWKVRHFYNVRPPVTIPKLANITPTSPWFMVLITIVTGANLNQLITGGPHIVVYIDGLRGKPKQ